MIAHYGEPKTETLIQGWLSNLATKPQAKDSLVMDAIAAGQCDFGLVNTYYYGGLQVKKPDTPLRLGWLNQKQQGTHINISGAGVLKHAKNPKGAQVLLEWLASEKAQALYAELNKEFPAKPGMPLDPMVQAWGEFKQDQLNLSRVGELQTSAAILINKVGYE
jgi:iron(III) transport system substrate-binding protein